MSSKKSDSSVALPLHADSGAAPWIVTLLSNAWVPVALLLIALLFRHYEYRDWPGAYIMHIAMLVGINMILAVSLQLINGVSGQFSLGHAGFMAVGAYLAGYAIKAFATVSTDADDVASDYYNPAAVLLFFIALLIAVALAAAAIFGLFLLIRQSRRLHSSLPGIFLIVVAAWFVADIAKGLQADFPSSGGTEQYDMSSERPKTVPSYLVFTKLITADKQLFDFVVAAGSERALKFSSSLPTAWRKPTTFIVSLIGGGALAAVAGLIVGLPTLRLRGDYLAIATLGFGEIIRIAIVNSPPLGGATGLQAPTYAMKPDPDEHILGYFISPWIFGAALLTILLIWRLTNSPRGRALRAVREDEIAAAATGINTTQQKVTAFVFGAFFAGVAGALYVNLDGYLNTASFAFMRSIEIVVMVTLGGLGSIWGAAIAAILLTVLPEVLRNVSPAVSEWRMVIYSLLLIGLMLLKSRGNWWQHIPVIRDLPIIGKARIA